MEDKYKNNKLYRIWLNTRYNNKNEFVDEWNTFVNFENWAITQGYEEGARLKRLDKTKPYGPNNCQFLIGKTEYNTHLYRIWVKIKYKSKYPICSEWSQFPNFEAWALSHGYEENTPDKLDLFIERANTYDPYTGTFTYEWNPMCCKFGVKNKR